MIEFLMNLGPDLAYLILLLGSCIEGESVVLTAGFLAYTGFLKLKWVVLIAFTGTLIADQVLFFIGHYQGKAILHRHPKWQQKTERIFRLLHRHNLLFILSFRFIYGIRTLSPLVIGTAGISVRRFVLLNLVAAVLWTLISCGAGYLLGYYFADHIDDIVEKIAHYQKVVFFSLGGLALLGTLFYGIQRYNRSKKPLTIEKDKNPIDGDRSAD